MTGLTFLFLVLPLSFFFLGHGVQALKCYSCNSTTNPDCGVPFNASKVDTCTDKYCWKYEVWKGMKLPVPANTVVTAERKCVSTRDSSMLSLSDEKSFLVSVCDDSDFCNGPLVLEPAPTPGSGDGRKVNCYACSGNDCKGPLSGMATCSGQSCYKEVHQNIVVNRTCLAAFYSDLSTSQKINNAVYSALICSKELCNGAGVVIISATLVAVVVAATALFISSF